MQGHNESLQNLGIPTRQEFKLDFEPTSGAIQEEDEENLVSARISDDRQVSKSGVATGEASGQTSERSEIRHEADSKKST